LDINTTLPELFTELVKIKGDYKINIHQFEPSMMIKYFNEMIPFFPYITKIILSAQSFNDRILKLM
jgi:tRNA A37 methylthiotransferase MiaB